MRRLLKGADEVFASAAVDAGFATDAAIDHGQQGGRNLQEIDAAHPGSGDEVGHVTGDAAAKGDDGTAVGRCDAAHRLATASHRW